MAEPEYAVDESGLLIPPSLGAFEPQPPVQALPQASVTAPPPSAIQRPGVPTRQPAPSPLPPAGKLNWIFGVFGVLTGLASFVWPLLCLTVLVSLALSAVGISRFNRLRRRGANGRAVAVVGLVIGLASAANLVFGISQMLQLGSLVDHLVP